MNVVIEAGVFEAVAVATVAVVSVTRERFSFVPFYKAPALVVRFISRGATSLNAVAPGNTLIEGGLAVA